MANPEAMNSTQQQGPRWTPPATDGLHLLYYAASTMDDFPEEQTDGQDSPHSTENDGQGAVMAAIEGKQGSKGKGKVRGSKEKMKPGFCDHCGVTEATVWRCIVNKNPDMGHRCNRCAMHLRNNGYLPVLPNKGQLIAQLTQLAGQVQEKREDSPRANLKRAACEIEAIDNNHMHGKIRRSSARSEGEDMPASEIDHSSDGTTPHKQSHTLMMDTQGYGSGPLLAATWSHESATFTIPAYRGEDDKQPRLKREASRRAGRLLAAMKDEEDSNVSGNRSQSSMGLKKVKNSRSRQNSNSGETLQVQHAPSAMQEDDYKSGPAQTAGLLTGMSAQGQVALPPPSLSLPALSTAHQFAAGNPHSLMAMPMAAAAGRNIHNVYIMNNNSMQAVGNQQMLPQYMVPRYYSIMPHNAMNASTGTAQPCTTPLVHGQHMQATSMMIHPGVAMGPGQHYQTPAMFVQPGMGMAFQGYAMQQLQEGQLNTAMSWVGNAST